LGGKKMNKATSEPEEVEISMTEFSVYAKLW